MTVANFNLENYEDENYEQPSTKTSWTTRYKGGSTIKTYCSRHSHKVPGNLSSPLQLKSVNIS